MHNLTLAARARALLESPALDGLGVHDRAVVVSMAAGMAAKRAGEEDSGMRGARLAGAHVEKVAEQAADDAKASKG